MTGQLCVLVVDNREENRYTVGHALKRAGYRVVEATTGQEALELSKQLPNLIILAVKLPDIVGYEVCRRIKSNPQTAHIPVLQLSSSLLSNENQVYALESGADAYLVRPTEPHILVATVKSLVRMEKAESEVRLSALEWQATFDALTVGVALLDNSFVISRCNRALSALLGQPYPALEGRSLAQVMDECWGLTLRLDEPMSNMDLRIEARYFRLNLHPICLHQDRTGSIFILAETTDQKRIEEALLMSERMAATGRMANIIAHEINNPLEAVKNLIYLLRDSLTDPETARNFLNMTEQELGRVSRISRQILAYNRDTDNPVQIRITDLLENVLFLHSRDLLKKNILVQRDWDESLCIYAHPAQLRQVFSNLIQNAIDASFPEGEIRIRVSRSQRWNGNNQKAVRTTIIDRGAGITPLNLGRIFAPFFTTKGIKGSGIGLWLSSNIVGQHKGRIQVRSCTRVPKTWTCFSVLLNACVPFQKDDQL